jgi:hypothetical protein
MDNKNKTNDECDEVINDQEFQKNLYSLASKQKNNTYLIDNLKIEQ